MSYFTKPDGSKVYFEDIGEAIEALHPQLSGKHIFQQLEVLGLWEDFRAGHTAMALPYSFTEYVLEEYLTRRNAA